MVAWRQPGDKPLVEPMIDYRGIYASLDLNGLKELSLKGVHDDIRHSRK